MNLDKLKSLIESNKVQYFIAAVITLNAVVLGVMTRTDLSPDELFFLERIDQACLAIFTVELLIKIVVYNKRFPFDPWNIFDFVVVIGSLALVSSSFSVLRAFRIFRILKVISEFDELRVLVKAMLKTIPSMTWALVLLVIIFYIFAVFGHAMFSEGFPDLFGSLGMSMFTLFQVMTFESWATAVARPIMDVFPLAWIYFFIFILLTSITVLNVMVGIVVEAVGQISEAEKMKNLEKQYQGKESIVKELQLLHEHIDRLEAMLQIKERQ